MTMTTTYLDLVTEKATGRVTEQVRREIGGLVSEGGLISEPAQLRTYECDGLTGFRVVPALVVLPASTEEVAAVVRVCARERIPFVARGAGTGLSGGALPVADGIVIGLARMREILSVDAENQRAVVQPGVTNLGISAAVAAHDLYYAPDPSSQVVCTIGGNVAENSGGAHCLKYGFTTNHVLGLTMVCADGSVVTLGGDSLDQVGPDLRARGRRLGGHRRHRHRDHRAVAAQARGGPHAGRRLPRRRAGGQRGQRHRLGRHHPGRRRDARRAGDRSVREGDRRRLLARHTRRAGG